MKKVIYISISILLVMLISIFIFGNISFASEEQVQEVQTETLENIKATVTETGDIYELEEFGSTLKYQDIKVKIEEGKLKGQVFEAVYCISYDTEGKIENYELNVGNTLDTTIMLENGGVKEVIILNYERTTYIYIMIAIFFLVILVIGRTKGIKAILAFIVTILGIFFVMLQSIINGQSAILMSILVSVGIIILTFIIISGFTKKTITAIIGTSGGVICAGVIAMLFGSLAKLSGVTEEAIYLSANSQQLVFNFRDLLFAGIVISSLGACMDVGMSIASALDELKEKNPLISKMELVRSGMNIGSDIIGTMTNTLILAYIGGSINIVLFYMVEQLAAGDILNIEIIATDIISAITASLGVMFTVPITAIVYGVLHRPGKEKYETKSKNVIDGKRSLKF